MKSILNPKRPWKVIRDNFGIAHIADADGRVFAQVLDEGSGLVAETMAASPELAELAGAQEVLAAALKRSAAVQPLQS